MPRKYGTTVHVSSRRPLMLRLKGTVILAIWRQLLLIGLFSAIVYLIFRFSSWKMPYSLSLVSVMGMVVSLLLVFRTNTAYDRYWEGRRLWSQMTLCIRNLTRTIWVCVQETETRDLLEKKSAINLLVAFAFATKHYLRDEYGYNYDDMIKLLSHIPKYSIPTSTQPMESKQALAFDLLTPTNIPVELSYYIGSYIKSCSNKGKIDASSVTVMNNALVSMMDCLTGFERILRTPIPLAYSIHLHHATWIYLLALPFQLVSNMGAVMIPATMLAAFTLLGILGIGYEIENPFNDDYNDLPLDDFCKVIQAEVDSMVAARAPVPAEWIFSENNYPLVQSHLSARDLSLLSLDEVHSLMQSENPRYTKEEEEKEKARVKHQKSAQPQRKDNDNGDGNISSVAAIGVGADTSND
ncbi:Bestrophin, RFP-TM, chloride channel-domain-containing protein [Lobosporangium transversale]|uniref:Bestrophin, RFP-TM, chloride channel-domain-containing protein n=1 Tax=Lobosporangium transversale TaxID=64571 RepID=A0A1Y2GSG6_9FUNG|nr:Bestrophin, RFP-TM, chloride channel-domain-containing protein [Lobosporangium transversale]ORZ21732.1 Bestrophin, RFP-TM, chloride channel-domain-containing protein [Lobosporangium transversale]|eukprot:XP_021882983.1 Bestrophin, RFP-TM, chloride channel-domain-containing protein [Lobosporangium transversale]